MSNTPLINQTHYYAQVDADYNILGFWGTTDGNLLALPQALSDEELDSMHIVRTGKTVKIRRNKPNNSYIVHKFIGTPENYKIISECDRLSETNRQQLCKLIIPKNRIEGPVTYRGKPTGAVFAIVSLLLTGTLHLYRKWKRQKQKEMNLKKQKRMSYDKPVSKKIASETV